MPSAKFLEQLAALEASSAARGSSQAEKIAALISFLHETLKTSPEDELSAHLNAFIETLFSDNIIVITARPVLSEFIKTLGSIENVAIKKTVYVNTLEKLQAKRVSFEEQDCDIREALADIYEAEEEHGEAAKVLAGIQLQPNSRQVSDDYRIRVYIRIMRNYLEDDEAIEADKYLNRTTMVVHKSQDPEVQLQFQLCHARILDSKRHFLNACSKYHQLSFSPLVAEADKMNCLSAAMTCAILAEAGPPRSRLLATLYKDERSPQLRQDYSLLEKMYLDRLITPKEVDEFAARLRPHQVALYEDGTTVLSKAVIEHNLLGASKLYNNIGVSELGVLLGLSPEKAEEYAARMIESKRLGGQIDQIDQLIYFDSSNSSGAAERVSGRQLRRWDENVSALAHAVENVTTMLQNQYPEYVAAHLVH